MIAEIQNPIAAEKDEIQGRDKIGRLEGLQLPACPDNRGFIGRPFRDQG